MRANLAKSLGAWHFANLDRLRCVTKALWYVQLAMRPIDEDLKTLRQFAFSSGLVSVTLASGTTAAIESLVLQLPEASPPRIQDGTLRKTYLSKPVLVLNGEELFGELAIVRLLEKDGWQAVWADTFHGSKFWSNMPSKSSPVALPTEVQGLYDRIAALKGSPSGCFDVIAWKDERRCFFEYKSLRDKSNKNELAWIAAAIDAGVDAQNLFFVGQRSR